MQDKIPPITPDNELQVLIIDNQNLVHEITKSAFNQLGIFNVRSAFNAYTAMGYCAETSFDFVLIAFNVSNDKDGFHLFEELKHYGHIKNTTTVIFISAETAEELVNCIVELQPDDFWVKPLSLNHVSHRLSYLIQIRKKLHKLMHCVHTHEYAAAIYHAERSLLDKALSEYHGRLRRIIGECLMSLREYEQAERYYHKLSTTIDFAWVHIGLAKSLLKQDKYDEAVTMLEDLLERSDTRFLAYDLMAQYYIEKEKYHNAYRQIKEAGRLAPRNIERNKKIWDLARLTNDKHGQLVAVKNMAKYAKNSIHDSPSLRLNVIRALLDLATASEEAKCAKLVKEINLEIKDLVDNNAVDKKLKEQLEIIKARTLCVVSDKRRADEIMQTIKPEISPSSIEDNLDKMKAFHELGMREHCFKILDGLHKQIEGDTFSTQVVDEYLKQEKINRHSINFTTKELKEMAATNYRENRLSPAFNNLKQAFTLSPNNRSVALSLLKVLAHIDKKDGLAQVHVDEAEKAVRFLSNEKLPNAQHDKLVEYSKQLGFTVADYITQDVTLTVPDAREATPETNGAQKQ